MILKSKLISEKLLKWYDHNARILPWRVFGEAKVDPYKVWISEIMLQQTTVNAVIPYFNLFIQKWPTNKILCKADLSEILNIWSGLGYYSRARNIHLCSLIVNKDFNNFFPDTEIDLMKLPGIGSYTAAAILAIAFNKRAVVIDGNIKRVISRLFFLEKPIKENYKQIWKFTDLITPYSRVGDFAQSLMDLGSQICTPSKPKCDQCPIIKECQSKNNKCENIIPKKVKKFKKPLRVGLSFIITKNQKVLIYKRLDKGLLAGLDSLPSTGWDNQTDERLNFVKNLKKKKFKRINHEFTHFTLNMEVYLVDYTLSENSSVELPEDFMWIKIEDIKNLSFSSLMNKIFRTAFND